MTTTKTNKKPAAVKPVSHAKQKPARALKDVSSVKLVPLNLIDIKPQIRTTIHAEDLQDLADDIRLRGLLQPVLLTPAGDRYTLVAGERRLRAVMLNKDTAIPALQVKVSPAAATLIQLAENIQREQLTLQDEAAAIRVLFDHHGTLTDVSQVVNKSKSWCSKRLATSMPDFAWPATNLLERGLCEDLEILNIVSQLCRLDYDTGNDLANAVIDGASRADARKALKDYKAAKKNPPAAAPDSAQIKAKIRRERSARKRAAHANERDHGTGEIFIQSAMMELEEIVAYEASDEDPTAKTYLDLLSDEQRAALLAHFKRLQDRADEMQFSDYAKALHPHSSNLTYPERLALIVALRGHNIADLYTFFASIKEANREQQP